MGRKDELGVFCKVCSLLGTNSRIITDLDALFSGKLRDVFCSDERTKQWLEKQEEKQQKFFCKIFTKKELQHKITLEKLITRLERYLSVIGKELLNIELSSTSNISLEFTSLIEKLNSLAQKHTNAESIDTFKTVVLQGTFVCRKELKSYLLSSSATMLQEIQSLLSLILAGAASCGVYILPNGCIENYYTQNKILFMPVLAKDKLFHEELQFIMNSDIKTIRYKYKDLIAILENVCAK